ncbi:hypothetical protein ACFYNW_37885 [Streptomyces virginiae]|uniref:hypothetical protein n=1 Tax=Streptomyces virginiae TaxID=1961 RepID=UPI0036DFFB84
MVTETEHAAQRRLVGVVRTTGVLTGGGLALWREYNARKWKASAAELSQDLDTLKVPHETVVAFRPPRAREVRRRKGQEVRVAFAELAKLVRWVPSLQQSIDELPTEMPGFTCGAQLCALDDGADSIAITLSALGNPGDLVPVNQSYRENAVPWLAPVPDTRTR